MTPTEAFPLTWPPGRPRAVRREESRFAVTLGAAFNQVRDEVARLGGTALVISTNLPLRRDGMPHLGARVTDPGVAVYFTLEKRPMCFACDRWCTVEENLRAIAKTIDALRGIERWGSGSMVEQAFTGFAALPAPAEQPWQVLGVGAHASREEVERAYRLLASKYHPDRGGDAAQMARINAARDALTTRR